jgi:hypothetical protein
MRPAFYFCTIVCIAVATLGCDQQKKANENQSRELEAAVRGMIELLADEEFDKATKDFDDTMKTEMSAAKIRETWRGFIAKFGAFKKQGKIRLERKDEYEIVLVPCAFTRGSLDVQVVFNSEKKIAGLSFRPTKTSSESKP